MSPAALIVLSLFLALGAFVHRMRRRGAAAPRVSPRRRPRPAAAPVAPAQPGIAAVVAPVVPRAPVAEIPAPGGELSARLRDRYIAARFPGMFGGSADLADADNVIRVARMYFEARKQFRPQELLEMALQQAPHARALRLAQLEIAFLTSDATLYVAAARGFKESFPDAEEWREIARLGHGLAPAEALFGAAGTHATHAHSHYGPWPDTPNWIQASWDLTAEVLAAEFHAAVTSADAMPGASRREAA